MFLRFTGGYRFVKRVLGEFGVKTRTAKILHRAGRSHMTVIRAFRPRDLSVIAALVIGTISAHAQEKSAESARGEEKLTEVVITGSRIARPELDRLEPTIVVGSELFDQ